MAPDPRGQSRAGHSSIKVTTDTYGYLFDGQDDALAERLDVLGDGEVAAEKPSNVVSLERK